MALEQRFTVALYKKAAKGFRGYPQATVIYYGPDDRVATKVVASIFLGEHGGPDEMKKWFSKKGDMRTDHTTNGEILEFLRTHEVRSVTMNLGLFGCPHEEGIDYPRGEPCPKCPFWAHRNRFTGEVEH
jgi:hypothetical protein